jgi:hypothetical protein
MCWAPSHAGRREGTYLFPVIDEDHRQPSKHEQHRASLCDQPPPPPSPHPRATSGLSFRPQRHPRAPCTALVGSSGVRAWARRGCRADVQGAPFKGPHHAAGVHELGGLLRGIQADGAIRQHTCDSHTRSAAVSTSPSWSERHSEEVVGAGGSYTPSVMRQMTASDMKNGCKLKDTTWCGPRASGSRANQSSAGRENQ